VTPPAKRRRLAALLVAACAVASPLDSRGLGGAARADSGSTAETASPGPAYVTLAFGRAEYAAGRACQVPAGALTIVDVARRLQDLGFRGTGIVVTDWPGRTTKGSTGGRYCPFGDIIYASWSDLELLRDTYHWDFVSEGRDHTPIGSLSDTQARDDICGSLHVLEQHGFRRAWGLFAYPGQRDVTTHVQESITATCYAYGRTYSRLPTSRSESTPPWFQRTRGTVGGPCNNPKLSCYDLKVTGTGGRYKSPALLRQYVHVQPGQWAVFQVYRLVVGASLHGQPRWDCNGPSWRDHWTSQHEIYCWNDYRTILTGIPLGAVVTDPATVATAWGRGLASVLATSDTGTGGRSAWWWVVPAAAVLAALAAAAVARRRRAPPPGPDRETAVLTVMPGLAAQPAAGEGVTAGRDVEVRGVISARQRSGSDRRLLVVTESGQRLWGPEPQALRDIEEGADVGFVADILPAPGGAAGFAFFARPRDARPLGPTAAGEPALRADPTAAPVAGQAADAAVLAPRPGVDELLHDLSRASIGMTFNQYASSAPGDIEGAAAVRLANLHAYLAGRRGADMLLVAGAATHGGARWSGIALTSERELLAWGEPFRTTCAERCWSDPAGAAVHDVLAELGLEHRVILWNVVPTVPYATTRPGASRRPTAAEVEAGAHFVTRLRALVEPHLVVAVGKLAHDVLGAEAPRVRHPSTTAPRLFAAELEAVLGRGGDEVRTLPLQGPERLV
jgi:hypothetical protein